MLFSSIRCINLDNSVKDSESVASQPRNATPTFWPICTHQNQEMSGPILSLQPEYQPECPLAREHREWRCKIQSARELMLDGGVPLDHQPELARIVFLVPSRSSGSSPA